METLKNFDWQKKYSKLVSLKRTGLEKIMGLDEETLLSMTSFGAEQFDLNIGNILIYLVLIF